MNIVSSGKARTLVIARLAGLFILAVVAIAFLTGRMLPSTMDSFQDSEVCGGASAGDDLPSATLMKAFTLNGASGTTTLTPDSNFNPTAQYPPEAGLEILQVKLSNNQIVYALFRGKGVAMTFQGIEVQFAKIQ